MLTDETLLLAFVVGFSVLAGLALRGWRSARVRCAGLIAENAALRSQINQRGAGGKFTKKSTN